MFNYCFARVLFWVILAAFLNAAKSQNDNQISLTKGEKFVLGCNYWVSHAGTNLWKDWQPDVVEANLKQISEAGSKKSN
jgi:hypothetical protein